VDQARGLTTLGLAHPTQRGVPFSYNSVSALQYAHWAINWLTWQAAAGQQFTCKYQLPSSMRLQATLFVHAALAFFDLFPTLMRAFLPVSGVPARLRFSASMRSITGALLGWAVGEAGLPFCFCSISRSIFSR